MNPFTLLSAFIAIAALPQMQWKSDSAIVILHRSAGLVAPENTIPAFEQAVKQGADGIETDIRKTSDGVLVIYHDDWVLSQRGPTGKIEEMTLAETQKLDVGVRFGPQWKGTRIPLFEDLLRFLKANNLKVYLDIKTAGIYDEVMQIVKEQGCLPLVHASGGQVPKDHYALPIPWIKGWNYTDGGEEDPEKMRDVIAKAQSGVYGIMCDDARSIVRALNRHPESRTLVPYVSTVRERLRTIPAAPKPDIVRNMQSDLQSSDANVRRASCLSLARKPSQSALDPLLHIAEFDPDYTVRQEACWALGSLRNRKSVATLLRIAQTPYEQKTAAATEYRGFFLKIAAGCELARLNSTAGRTALTTLLNSKGEMDRAAAAVGLAVFGTEQDLPTILTLVNVGPDNDGFVAGFVIGYVGRFGPKALPIYLTALGREDTAKVAVFGIAALRLGIVPSLNKAMADPKVEPQIRRRIKLTLDWMTHP